MRAPIPLTTDDARRFIGRVIFDYRVAQTLFTAVDLGVFQHLRDDARPAVAVAIACRLDEVACGRLLDALTGVGFLIKDATGYRITEASEALLLAESPEGLAHNLRYQNFAWQAWSGLSDFLREGRPRRDLDAWLSDKDFVRNYILGMREIARQPSREVAARLAGPSLRRLLDVGGGPGSYALALLEACPDLTATVLDLPSTLAFTQELTADHQAAPRLTLRPDDYRTADLGCEAEDLVLFSHVTHDEDVATNRALLARAWRALRPGGRVAVHDFVLSDDGTQPVFNALLALHFGVCTGEGGVWTEEQYVRWLTDAGFRDIQQFPICPSAPNATVLIVGRRPEERR